MVFFCGIQFLLALKKLWGAYILHLYTIFIELPNILATDFCITLYTSVWDCFTTVSKIKLWLCVYYRDSQFSLKCSYVVDPFASVVIVKVTSHCVSSSPVNIFGLFGLICDLTFQSFCNWKFSTDDLRWDYSTNIRHHQLNFSSFNRYRVNLRLNIVQKYQWYRGRLHETKTVYTLIDHVLIVCLDYSPYWDIVMVRF